MDALALGRRFLDTTRGRIVALLRRRERTVEELARALGLTDNAVRSHLSALERDGLVRQEGVRRGGGAGKPAVVYELHPDAAPLLSRAYPSVLGTVMDVITDELPEARRIALLREVGRRLAARSGGQARGDFAARVRTAAAVLESLGGDVEVEVRDGGSRIRGAGCPVSSIVCHQPEFCNAVESMVAEIVGRPAQSCCTHGAKPSCCFEIAEA